MNKASGGNGIPVERFQILKGDAVKVLHSICQQTWKTQQWPQVYKRSVFIPIQKKDNAKECSNYCTIALISYARKVILKILQARLQQYMNCNFHLPHAKQALGGDRACGTRGSELVVRLERQVGSGNLRALLMIRSREEWEQRD